MYKKLTPKFLVLILVFAANLCHAHKIIPISYIKEIIPYLENCNSSDLVIFDVDNTISAPVDLIGRPKARAIRRKIFDNYKKEFGIERVKKIHSLYMKYGTSALVEDDIKDIITKLQSKKIPTIALTAKTTEKFSTISDPIKWRLRKLKEKGINFYFNNINNRFLWENKSGYESGVIFSGKLSKGNALVKFFKTVNWKPNNIIFIDDNVDYLKTVQKVCTDLNIEFLGFHYEAAIFSQDPLISLEVAKLQIDTLDKKQLWLSDSEALKIIEKRKN